MTVNWGRQSWTQWWRGPGESAASAASSSWPSRRFGWSAEVSTSTAQPGVALAAASCVIVAAVLGYGIRVTADSPPRQTGPEAKRIERSVTVATVIELVASFILPVIVIAAGHRDWVLPSIAITIGPLLLWLDHLVHIPRYRPVGWALTIGPVVLVATMSGSALAATTGIAAGVLLLGTAAAGFHDLAGLRPQTGPLRSRAQPPGHMTMPQARGPTPRFRPFFRSGNRRADRVHRHRGGQRRDDGQVQLHQRARWCHHRANRSTGSTRRAPAGRPEDKHRFSPGAHVGANRRGPSPG